MDKNLDFSNLINSDKNDGGRFFDLVEGKDDNIIRINSFPDNLPEPRFVAHYKEDTDGNKICSICGNVITPSPSTNFCNQCGSKLTEAIPQKYDRVKDLENLSREELIQEIIDMADTIDYYIREYDIPYNNQ